MWTHNLNPTLLSLGPLEVRWYGVVYVLGFFLALWWLFHLRKKDQINLTKDQTWDYVFYVMIGVLIGARAFMLLWNPEIYLARPWELLYVWQGGMSFHGAFVGSIIGAWVYCKKHNKNFFKLADAMSVPLMFVLALGRVANFINGELVGKLSSSKWCVVFPDYDSNCRHPSTIYAAVKRFAVFGWLMILQLKNYFKPGFIFWNFVFWEGLGRIIVDFYRLNDLFLGLSLGQWLSIPMVLVGLWAFNKYHKEDWKRLFSKAK